MKISRSSAAATASLLLHVGLLAAAATRLSVQPDKPAEPLPITIYLVAEQKIDTPPAPLAPLPAVSVEPPPEKKRVERKPKPAPKPVQSTVKSHKQTMAEVTTQVVPPAPPETVSAAPPTPAPEAAPVPSAPVRTSVSIPASYAASNRKPSYPSLSRQYEEQGTVVLRVFVKADGTAGQIEIKSSSGYPLLDQSAKTAVQSWRFNPATSDGKPAADWFLIPIPFKLQN